MNPLVSVFNIESLHHNFYLFINFTFKVNKIVFIHYILIQFVNHIHKNVTDIIIIV